MRFDPYFAFLHEFAQLATQARDWDELMRTLVDPTTVALGVEVCSFYLLDRDGGAPDPGRDEWPGPRAGWGGVSLAVGEGVTGLAAEARQPVSSTPTSRRMITSSRVRGFDIAGLHAMLSMPLVWNEGVVGVLNVQTTATREFTPDEIEFLGTIAALLAGIVEKGRMQAEAEAQLDPALAAGRGPREDLAVVTHELRTPLAVVPAYVDLLADAAAANADESGAMVVANWRAAASDQVTRLDRLVDSILASVRGEGLTGLRTRSVRRRDLDRQDGRDARSPAPDARRPLGAPARGDGRARRRDPLPPGPGAPPGQRGQVRAARAGRVSWACGGRPEEIQVYMPGGSAGVPFDDWEAVFQPYVSVGAAARSRGSGIGLFAARRLMEAMGGRVWIEKNGFGGFRFVIALPVA